MSRFVANTITFPYKRSLGPVVGAFMTAMTERQLEFSQTQHELVPGPIIR